MAEVLVNTVGYDDSDLSDYENNFNINNNLIYQNFKSNYKFNYNQKSPRFGIDNINTNNKVNSINNEEEFGNGNVLEFGKKLERISYRNSLDTIDSINNNENVFKWWCDENDYSDDFSDDSFFSPVTVSSNTATPGKGTNTLTTTNTKDTNIIGANTVTEENNTTNFAAPKVGTGTLGNPATNSTEDITVGASTVTEDNSGWKSWTNGTNQLQELKSKILNKLLNNIKPVTVSGAQGKGADSTAMECTMGKGANSMVTECTTTVGASTVMEELKYYKNMNKILIEKLIYIINNNNKLEYNINNNYVTLIQNHLIKTQSFLNSITGTTNNLTTTEGTSTVGPSSVTEENSTTKIAAPNLHTGPEGTGFETQSITTTTEVTNTNTTLNEDTNTVTTTEEGAIVGASTVTGDTVMKIKELELNNKELEEKIKIIEESKNNLEEDFKKTLTYMKLMKDRLKLFKQNNTQITTTNSTNNFTTSTNNFTTNTLNTHNSLNTLNTLNTTTNMNNMNKRNKLRRNNSSVRFKEMSELYVVPRSLSETKPIINNNKFNFFKNLFK
ncbi:uncharacterized protein TA15535 [Theileria annulata]|uniref:Uncharacterized protein n=1 Tax=Theileria annulata TaxID=5874 RepID=Q4UFJ6_THEAN|nr:uncharacterized protein TA15535 [Theileria annulata]CAI74120.1 hypothetical protein TA15535 [Theileria annulata]|eukprot:XP_951852.1 hypothetical protein TA15535 [Theileria annulata]